MFDEQDRRIRRLREANERRQQTKLESRRRWARIGTLHHHSQAMEFAALGREAEAQRSYEAALEFLLEWREVDPLAALLVLTDPFVVGSVNGVESDPRIG